MKTKGLVGIPELGHFTLWRTGPKYPLDGLKLCELV
jgi:hypothetical protein